MFMCYVNWMCAERVTLSLQNCAIERKRIGKQNYDESARFGESVSLPVRDKVQSNIYVKKGRFGLFVVLHLPL